MKETMQEGVIVVDPVVIYVIALPSGGSFKPVRKMTAWHVKGRRTDAVSGGQWASSFVCDSTLIFKQFNITTSKQI